MASVKKKKKKKSRSFYAATKKLASATTCREWGVADLFPGKDGRQVGREVLDFFGRISSIEAKELPDVPRVPGGLPVLDRAAVIKILKESKKSDSMVEGDPLPHLVRHFPEAFVQPVGMIFNWVNESGGGPRHGRRSTSRSYRRHQTPHFWSAET